MFREYATYQRLQDEKDKKKKQEQINRKKEPNFNKLRLLKSHF